MIKKDSFNFVLCGDSISKGVIFDEEKNKYVTIEENYANLLKNKLNGVIYNAGRFGNTITRAIGKLQNDVIKNNPDIVIIEFGGNDCDFRWNEIAENPFADHEPNTDFAIFQNSLKNLISHLRSIGAVPVLMSLPPLDPDKYFKWISHNSSTAAEKILTWLGSVNKIYWWQERYNSAIISIAQETRTKWIDVRSAFLNTPDFRQFLCVDGIHPNRDGHKLIADKIWEYMDTHKYYYLMKQNGSGILALNN
jgi:lysophospholipase L1-like esterase